MINGLLSSVGKVSGSTYSAPAGRSASRGSGWSGLFGCPFRVGAVGSGTISAVAPKTRLTCSEEHDALAASGT